MNVCTRSRGSLAGVGGDEKGRGAKGKGESYFWLLSRKSNLRSLTPKELQMHGRQHTGVSIYEARTGTREKDERSGRSERSRSGSRNGRWRDKDKTERERRGRGEGERKRDEDPKKQDAAGRASMRELNDYGYGLPRLSPIILVPKPVSSTPDADPLLES